MSTFTPRDWYAAHDYMTRTHGSKTSRPLNGRHTRLCTGEETSPGVRSYYVQYHDTRVVTYYPKMSGNDSDVGTALIDTGGHDTPSTRDAINRYSRAHVTLVHGALHISSNPTLGWRAPSAPIVKPVRIDASTGIPIMGDSERVVRELIEQYVGVVHHRIAYRDGIGDMDDTGCPSCRVALNRFDAGVVDYYPDVSRVFNHLRRQRYCGALVVLSMRAMGASPRDTLEAINNQAIAMRVAPDAVRAFLLHRDRLFPLIAAHASGQ